MSLPWPSGALRGRRILVVEDEFFTAEDLRQELEAHGAAVLGPVPRVADALELLALDAPPDAAILDVQLGDGLSYPVALVLEDLSVPFVFVTALHRSQLPLRFAHVPCFEKVVDMAELMRALSRR